MWSRTWLGRMLGELGKTGGLGDIVPCDTIKGVSSKASGRVWCAAPQRAVGAHLHELVTRSLTSRSSITPSSSAFNSSAVPHPSPTRPLAAAAAAAPVPAPVPAPAPAVGKAAGEEEDEERGAARKVDSAPPPLLLTAAGAIVPRATTGSGGTAAAAVAAPSGADASTVGGSGGGGTKSLALPVSMVTVPVADTPPADSWSPVAVSSPAPEAVEAAPLAPLERGSEGEGLVAARSR